MKRRGWLSSRAIELEPGFSDMLGSFRSEIPRR
jgi:hypothetical protein